MAKKKAKQVQPVAPIKKAVAPNPQPKPVEAETFDIGTEEAQKLAEKMQRVEALKKDKQTLINQLMGIEKMLEDASDAMTLKRMRLEDSHKINKDRKITFIDVGKGSIDVAK